MKNFQWVDNIMFIQLETFVGVKLEADLDISATKFV